MTRSFPSSAAVLLLALAPAACAVKFSDSIPPPYGDAAVDTGCPWNGVIELLQGDAWVEMGSSADVRASNWLCVSGAVPQ